MVTITRYVFINIFQAEHFLNVKFVMGYEKNISILWYQNLQKFAKELKKCDGSFRYEETL